MRERLVHDKEAWEAEKRADERRKEKEQERLRASFYWEDLRAEQRCLRYGARRYSARVANVPREYDPVQACKETAVEIHGVEIRSPTQCEDKVIYIPFHRVLVLIMSLSGLRRCLWTLDGRLFGADL
jgi:hypothetical protein